MKDKKQLKHIFKKSLHHFDALDICIMCLSKIKTWAGTLVTKNGKPE